MIIGHNAEMAMAAGGGSAHADYFHGPSLIQALADVGGSGFQVIEVPWQNGNKPYGTNGNSELPDVSIDDIKSADAVIACVRLQRLQRQLLGYKQEPAKRRGRRDDTHL